MNNNSNNSNNIDQSNQPLYNWRAQRRLWRQIRYELVRTLTTQLSEDDIRHILSVPAQKRNSFFQVNDPDVISRYFPREYNGYSITYQKAIQIIDDVVAPALDKRLSEIAEYVDIKEERGPGDSWQYVIYYCPKTFVMPDYLKGLSIITTREHPLCRTI